MDNSHQDSSNANLDAMDVQACYNDSLDANNNGDVKADSKDSLDGNDDQHRHMEIQLPFNVSVSRAKSKIPHIEIEWLKQHLRKAKCRPLLPELRRMYNEDKLLRDFVQLKWPEIDDKLRLRRLRDLMIKYS